MLRGASLSRFLMSSCKSTVGGSLCGNIRTSTQALHTTGGHCGAVTCGKETVSNEEEFCSIPALSYLVRGQARFTFGEAEIEGWVGVHSTGRAGCHLHSSESQIKQISLACATKLITEPSSLSPFSMLIEEILSGKKSNDQITLVFWISALGLRSRDLIWA